MLNIIRTTALNTLLIAVFCLLAAVILIPLAAELSFNSGEKLVKEYRWAQAEGKFREAARLDPLSSRYVSGYAEFLRKSSRYSYDKTGLLNKAIELYDKAIALEPDSSEYYLKRALAKLESRKPVKDAFGDLWEAFRRDPNSYSVAYAVGYTGMNFWKSLDGKDKDFVADRLAYVVKIDPNQAQKAYGAAWKATKDFSLLKKIAADTQQGRAGLYGFMAARNLWQYRKEIAEPVKEYPGRIDNIKTKIVEAEKNAEANAWERADGKTVLAKGGEAILARGKARAERRQNSLVAPEDWITVSRDLKKVGYANGALYTNGTIYALTDLREGESSVMIEARGSPSGGVWPYMVVEVDGREVGEAFVDSDEMKPYEFKIKTTGDSALIGVRFMNDANDPKKKEDRNLWVGRAEVKVKAEVEAEKK